MKKTIQLFLLGFVVFSLAYGFWGKSFPESKTDKLAAAGISQPEQSENAVAQTEATTLECASDSGTKVIAYYFHGNQRCRTCRKLEAYAKEAIETAFVEEMAQGQVEFQTVNFDADQNEHFVEKYDLFASTLVASKIECGREAEWKNLKEVWRLVQTKAKFLEYVQDELKKLIG